MRLRKKKTSVNKKVRNATPLKYSGIQFRSKLEVYCFQKLKEAELKFKYEGFTYELEPSFKFRNDSFEVFMRKGDKIYGQQRDHIRSINYTPDFVGKEWIIETKGMPSDAFKIRWKMFKRYLNDNNRNIDLFMPRNRKQIDETIKIILNKYK